MNEMWSRVLGAWDNLSGRERRLVGLAGGIAAIALIALGIVQPLMAYAANIELRAENAEQKLQVMVRLRRDFDAVQASLTKVEDRINANQEKRNLLTLLEALAQESSVKISSMEERKSLDDVKFKETRVEVRLKRVTLKDTVSYLHAIEASNRLLTVKSLHIKNRTDKSSLLDVNFNVSTFDPL